MISLSDSEEEERAVLYLSNGVNKIHSVEQRTFFQRFYLWIRVNQKLILISCIVFEVPVLPLVLILLS